LVYYLDASIQIDVYRALASVRDDVLYPGEAGCPIESPATLDSVWLPIAGEHGWIVLYRDKKVRTRPGERQAFIDAKVPLFCMTGSGNASKWTTLTLLVRRWDRIEEVANTEAPPYIYSVTQDGVRRLHPPPSAT
jgi:PIN like domain